MGLVKLVAEGTERAAAVAVEMVEGVAAEPAGAAAVAEVWMEADTAEVTEEEELRVEVVSLED